MAQYPYLTTPIKTARKPGSILFKPCVSANVGDQFGPANQHLLAKVFSWFYFAINIGSMFSTLLIPEHRKALANLCILVPFAAMFWALCQQNFSSWVMLGTAVLFMIVALFYRGKTYTASA